MIALDTSVGVAHAHEFGDVASGVTIVASHGAGGGIEAFDLQALRQLRVNGHRVHGFLLEQPWRVAGKKLAPRPQILDTAWSEALPQLPRGRCLVLAGRSAGARVACRTAQLLNANAVITLAFPLHPPGKPETSRADELALPVVPVLALQGERDPFGSAIELRAATGDELRVVELPWADHSLRVPKTSGLTQDDTEQRIRSAITEFLEGMNLTA